MPATLATGRSDSVEGRHRNASQGGFTLIELMVVLAIVVLVMASLPLAINRMLPSRRVVVAADRLVSDIRWLQLQSVASGARARLSVTESGYRLDVQHEKQGREVVLSDSTMLRFRARDEDRAIPGLLVYPDGTSSAGQFEIADADRRAIVEISLLTGRARRVL